MWYQLVCVLLSLKLSVKSSRSSDLKKHVYVCMWYVLCNHDPGPSVLGVPDPRCTDRLRVKCQYPNSQSPHTSNNVQNRDLSPTTSSHWYDVRTQIHIK
jgi:hypothetical protein